MTRESECRLPGEQGHVDLIPGEASESLPLKLTFIVATAFTLLAAIPAFVQVGRYWGHEPPGAFTAELGRQAGAVVLGTGESSLAAPSSLWFPFTEHDL